MIHIAAHHQSLEELTDEAAAGRLGAEVVPHEQLDYGTMVAFIGYAGWRREENGDGNLSDEQVLVVRNGKAHFLNPRNDLRDHSPDGLSWGYSGSACAQLSLAMLMEVFDDWERVQPIYQRFKDHFVARLPQHTNWTADGTDIAAVARAIEQK